MAVVTINVKELISFYDEDAAARTHASAVKAIAGEELGLPLLVQYFRSQRVEAEIFPGRCTTGKAKGVRLDGWLKVTLGAAVTLYQVEVKTWSRFSVQGRALPLSVSPEAMAEFKVERWGRYWTGGRFRDNELNKVLTPMKPPVLGVPVEPLACLWDAMHPTGGPQPFFVVPIASGHFSRVHVFSMSTFLRAMNVKTLDLELPAAAERLRWLARIFPGRPAP